MYSVFFDTGAESTLRDLGPIDRMPVEVFLRNGNPSGAANVVATLLDNIGEVHLKSSLFRVYITLDVHIAAKAFAEGIGVDRDLFLQRFGSPEQAVRHTHTRESVQRYLAEMLEQCVLWRRMYSQGSSFMIERAQAYISEHYTNEDISLAQISSAVNVSPAYFSHLFKKETGISLISHITSLRMERAKHLLRCSNMKISEVARQVGYRDYHYFCGTFKRYAGLTPSEFRSLQEAGNALEL